MNTLYPEPQGLCAMCGFETNSRWALDNHRCPPLLAYREPTETSLGEGTPLEIKITDYGANL